MSVQLQISDNEAWYLRSVLGKALILNAKEIENLDEFLHSDEAKTTARTFVMSIEGARDYMLQWDREVREYLQLLAEALDTDLARIDPPSILKEV